ncbi:ABC transporter substrate-binding protein [Oenococcus kitaharae]|uniref:ABC transporter substrate-binding protein n=1 Tax=Oenococcus TaxID=46254 RepID=UPI0021E766C4|nr:ABC transporter substrate-binding protein [Oenococcus kitaharae]MCV3296502.1 ABC transporter substrate-binding protein [Oenococcus kitaharae]
MNLKRMSLLLLTLFCVISIAVLEFANYGSTSNSHTIEFFNQKPEVTSGYQELARLYEKTHPNIKVKITTVGNGSGASALQAKFVSGDAPDIVMLGGLPEIDRYHNRLLNLDNLPIQKKIVPSLKSGGRIYGHSLGVAVDIEGYGWAYNKAVFKKAGIDAGRIKDYASFKAAVEKLNAQKKALGLSGVFGFNGADTSSITSFSAQFLSQSYHNNLTKAYRSQHLNWRYSKRMADYVDLVKRYNVKPILSVRYDASVQDLFFHGKVAMIPQGNWIIPTLDEAQKGFSAKNLGMLPYFVKGQGQIMTGSSWYLGITNEHPQREKDAKDFLQWLYNSPESEKVIVQQMRYVPPTINFDLNKLPDPLSKEIYRIGTGKHAQVPVHKQFPNGFNQEAIGPNMQRYFANKISWQQFVQRTESQYYQLRQIQGGK